MVHFAVPHIKNWKSIRYRYDKERKSGLGSDYLSHCSYAPDIYVIDQAYDAICND